MGPMLDPDSGRVRSLWALIITLSFSRYQFVWPSFLQTTETVCEGLDHAWAFFAAMIRTIVPDNMKAIVKTPDALSPILVTAFLDYVQARGIFVDPARIRSPQDKPRVENQVPYVRESWFDGETFTGLDDARRSAETWCRDVAGVRVHGSTRQVPRVLFESTEKPAMLAPPTEPFDVPLWVEEAKVHPDHHIQVARALYSVPSIHCHKIVRARRQDVHQDLLGHGAHQNARASAAGRSLDRPERLPLGQGRLRPSQRRRAASPRSPQGHPRRHLRRAVARRTAAVGADARRVRAPAPLRQIQRRSRRSRLPERPGVRRRRCRAHHAHAQGRRQARLAHKPRRQTRAAPAAAIRPIRSALRDAHFEQEGGRLMAAAAINPELVTALKRLKLGRILDTLPERLVLADKQKMSLDDLLLLVLTDEIARRDSTAADNRARDAGLDPSMRLELWDKSSKVTFDRRMLAELVSLRFLEAHRHVVVLGPVGVGKTFVSQALGHGYNVRFVRADAMLRTLRQSRLDNSRDAEMVSLTSVDLIVVDDFALEPMTKEESKDVYQLFLERTGRASMIVTSNRDTAEWLAMFDDVLLAQSAVDRFKNAAYDFVIEGESYRPRLKPALDAANPPPTVPANKTRPHPRSRRR
jgi:DNA replication protein DnaC